MQAAIRPATEADFPAMDSLTTAAIRQECADVYAPEVVEAWVGASSLRRFEQAAAHGVHYYVAEHKGRIVAYGGIDLAEGLIRALFVAPEHAGEAVGETMLAYLLRNARTHRLSSLRVESSLNAASFYQRHGFRSYAQQVVDLDSGLQLEAVLMRWPAGA
jgi:N-acetylglutamate synthase-like GNAT family acetyltransferase